METTLIQNLHSEGLELLLSFKHYKSSPPVTLTIYESLETRPFNIPELKIEGDSLQTIILQIPSYLDKKIVCENVRTAMAAAWRRTYEELAHNLD
jgi:hypothetical protein